MSKERTIRLVAFVCLILRVGTLLQTNHLAQQQTHTAGCLYGCSGGTWKPGIILETSEYAHCTSLCRTIPAFSQSRPLAATDSRDLYTEQRLRTSSIVMQRSAVSPRRFHEYPRSTRQLAGGNFTGLRVPEPFDAVCHFALSVFRLRNTLQRRIK